MAQPTSEMLKAETLAAVWEMAVGHATSFGLKAAVSLGIPDILSASQHPMSLQEITEKLPGTNVQENDLLRLLNFLVAKNVFERVEEDGEEEGKYKVTRYSELLTSSSFAGLVMLQNQVITCGWHHMHEFILHGGQSPFQRAQGMSLWDKMQSEPELAKCFSQGMVAMSNVTMDAILACYDGFGELTGTLVDVGGAFGVDVGRIVSAHPHLRGVNLDLPAVVQVAPELPGVEHVGGDMFHAIPKADNILLKSVLHDFDDGAALEVLENCHGALPKGGKVIIVDIVMDPERGPFQTLKLAFDLVLLALTNGGLERTRSQWTQLVSRAGFGNVKFVSSPEALQGVIEAEK